MSKLGHGVKHATTFFKGGTKVGLGLCAQTASPIAGWIGFLTGLTIIGLPLSAYMLDLSEGLSEVSVEMIDEGREDIDDAFESHYY